MLGHLQTYPFVSLAADRLVSCVVFALSFSPGKIIRLIELCYVPGYVQGSIVNREIAVVCKARREIRESSFWTSVFTMSLT